MASRRGANREKPRHVAAPPEPSVSIPLMPLSGWLLAAAVVVVALGGGILYDRVLASGPASPLELIGTPLTSMLVATGLLASFWHPAERLQDSAGKYGIQVGAAAAGFLTWCALSLTRSAYLHASLTSLAMLVVSAAAGVVAYRLARRSESVVALLAALSGAATLVSAIGAQEYLRELRGGNPLWRVFAGFVNPDFLAGYLVMAVPVSVALLLVARRPVARLAAGTAVLLQAACLVLTGSRLGLATLLVSMAAMGGIAIRGRLLSPQAKRIALVAAALLTVGIVVAGRPLLRRLLTSGTEAYSAQFRARTWRGTERMAAANPILGTGIGTFDTAYAPYAEVGYTQHAHNSYLQLAGETGCLGMLLFAATLGLALWYAAASALRRGADDETDSADMNRRLLVAGLTTAALAAALHNLSDSDLFVPANCLTLGVIIGLLLALADRREALDVQPAAAKRTPMAGVAAAVVSLLILVHSVATLTGRTAANGAEIDYASAAAAMTSSSQDSSTPEAIRADLERAADGYRQAESRDPLNPEYPLKLATVVETLGRKDEAEAASRRAIERAGIGKTFYRYGKLLAREGKTEEAARMHEAARRVEPNNLDNLLALADAYTALNRPAEAEAIWKHMAMLYSSDFGRIRAVPELIDWQYGRAYQLLGQTDLQRGETARAAGYLHQAVGILGTFWKQRDLLIAQIRVRTEDRKRTADYYQESLAAYQKALTALGRRQEAGEAKAEESKFQQER
jgi:O-antigen ligase